MSGSVEQRYVVTVAINGIISFSPVQIGPVCLGTPTYHLHKLADGNILFKKTDTPVDWPGTYRAGGVMLGGGMLPGGVPAVPTSSLLDSARVFMSGSGGGGLGGLGQL